MGASWILFLGILLTAAMVSACYLIAVLPYCELFDGQELCTTNFHEFVASPPNEKGDTLAGIAGSLAFLWLIITVLLQWRELSAQRNELTLMREDNTKSREALELQSMILGAEFASQQQVRHDTLAQAFLDGLDADIKMISENLGGWTYEYSTDSENWIERHIDIFDTTKFEYRSYASYATNIKLALFEFLLGPDEFWSGEKQAEIRITKKPPKTPVHQNILSTLDRLVSESESCTPWMQVRMSKLGVPYFRKKFREIMEVDEYWSGVIEPLED